MGFCGGTTCHNPCFMIGCAQTKALQCLTTQGYGHSNTAGDGDWIATRPPPVKA